jgi:hypothetical protein
LHDRKRYFAATESHEPTGVLVTLVVETTFWGKPKDFRKPVAKFLWKPGSDQVETHKNVVQVLTQMHPSLWPEFEAKVKGEGSTTHQYD